jgi:hypothetical protein
MAYVHVSLIFYCTYMKLNIFVSTFLIIYVNSWNTKIMCFVAHNMCHMCIGENGKFAWKHVNLVSLTIKNLWKSSNGTFYLTTTWESICVNKLYLIIHGKVSCSVLLVSLTTNQVVEFSLL